MKPRKYREALATVAYVNHTFLVFDPANLAFVPWAHLNPSSLEALPVPRSPKISEQWERFIETPLSVLYSQFGTGSSVELGCIPVNVYRSGRVTEPLAQRRLRPAWSGRETLMVIDERHRHPACGSLKSLLEASGIGIPADLRKEGVY